MRGKRPSKLSRPKQKATKPFPREAFFYASASNPSLDTLFLGLNWNAGEHLKLFEKISDAEHSLTPYAKVIAVIDKQTLAALGHHPGVIPSFAISHWIIYQHIFENFLYVPATPSTRIAIKALNKNHTLLMQSLTQSTGLLNPKITPQFTLYLTELITLCGGKREFLENAQNFLVDTGLYHPEIDNFIKKIDKAYNITLDYTPRKPKRDA